MAQLIQTIIMKDDVATLCLSHRLFGCLKRHLMTLS